MKIAVLADTHSLPLPPQLLEALKNVDLIVHAGDICDVATLNILKKIKEVKAVQGNMCETPLKYQLPLILCFECEKVRIGVYHGHRPSRDALENAREQFKDTPLDIVIFGHSHQALNQTIGQTLFFNPGSPNDVTIAKFFSYGLLEVHDGKIKVEIVKL